MTAPEDRAAGAVVLREQWVENSRIGPVLVRAEVSVDETGGLVADRTVALCRPPKRAQDPAPQDPKREPGGSL